MGARARGQCVADRHAREKTAEDMAAARQRTRMNHPQKPKGSDDLFEHGVVVRFIGPNPFLGKVEARADGGEPKHDQDAVNGDGAAEISKPLLRDGGVGHGTDVQLPLAELDVGETDGFAFAGRARVRHGRGVYGARRGSHGGKERG